MGDVFLKQVNRILPDGTALRGVFDNEQVPGARLERLECDESVFTNCRFSGCSFGGSNWNRVNFVRCDFSNCDFSESYLQNCCFESCKAVGSQWLQASEFARLLGLTIRE
ncbi:MAG: pentapeptide repeat-containing protein [Acutalibacteraceae bacterium]